MVAEYSPADECNALRTELTQGKKYVFERPLLIVTISLAALNFVDKVYVIYLPPIAICFLMFNLWFTVNRLKSISRIVAYIQLELEEKLWRPWLGWETCLRYYRIWIKTHCSERKCLVNAQIDKDAVPDAIGYYPTIYMMHIVLVILLLIGSLYTFLSKPTNETMLLLAITLMVVAWFSIAAFIWRPNVCKNFIEENRILWMLVFDDLALNGIKKLDCSFNNSVNGSSNS